MNLIFVIDSSNKTISEHSLGLIKNSRSSSFLFIKKNEYIQNQILENNNISVISVGDNYDELLDRSRDNIINYFEKIPHNIFKAKNGPSHSFHSLFSYKGLSAWWLMGFSNKAPEGGGCINRLFQIDIIDYYLNRNYYDCGVIISDEAGFENCVKNLFIKHKISCGNEPVVSLRKDFYYAPFYIKRIIILLKLIAVKLFTLLFMLFIKTNSDNANNTAVNKICFHSWFPAHWININGKDYCDKYYADLIKYIFQNSKKIKPFYLFKLMSYDSNFKDFYKNFTKVFTIGAEFDFIERYLPVWPMAKLLLTPFDILRYAECEKNIEFINNFKYCGINIFDLVRSELRISYFYNFPYHAAVTEATHNYFNNNTDVKVFITFLELYSYSRGVYDRLSKFERLKTIAFQHSTITKYNLHYNYDISEIDALNKFKLPLPDFFILSGKVPGNTLRNFGVPENSIKISGSPRYEFINQYIDKKSSIIKSSQNKTVLLATVGEREDTMQLVKLVLEAISGQPKIDLIIKTHPMCNIKNEIKTCISNDYKNICYEFNDDYIYETIIKSDLLITSNSMTGLEALVLGTDIVLYGDPFKINISPLAESLEFKDKICYSDDGFIDAIKKAIDKKAEPHDPQKIKRLISNFYYKLDGRVNKRILKILEEIIDGKI